jgi:uncharacterized protein DUF2183
MNVAILSVAFMVAQVESPIKRDEVVTFIPTYGHLEKDGSAVLPIHGWIYEPEVDGFLRRQTLELFRKSMGLSPEEAATGIFKERAAFFLVDNERRKKVPVQVGEQVVVMEESGANGHFKGEVRLAADQVKKLQAAGGWVPYRAVVPDGDARQFAGRVQVLAETGFSVITDIDDTIKISEVRKKTALLANTFIREFQAVPGMPAAFQKWQAKGATFHYVSASPWQLYVPLVQFQEKNGFPAGTWHLKDFRWKDSSFWNLLASPEKTKNTAIEPLLQAFPRRKFICVGDSGEKDPEIYAELARKHPDQIVRILIRSVTDEDATAERYRKAFAGLPRECWQVFKEPKEIGTIPGLP